MDSRRDGLGSSEFIWKEEVGEEVKPNEIEKVIDIVLSFAGPGYEDKNNYREIRESFKRLTYREDISIHELMVAWSHTVGRDGIDCGVEMFMGCILGILATRAAQLEDYSKIQLMVDVMTRREKELAEIEKRQRYSSGQNFH